MSLLSDLVACIYAEYPTDHTKAGVVLSQLSATGDFYASVCRYPHGPGPGQKQIVCKAKGKTLDEAVRGLAVSWLLETRRFETLRIALLPCSPFNKLLSRTLVETR